MTRTIRLSSDHWRTSRLLSHRYLDASFFIGRTMFSIAWYILSHIYISRIAAYITFCQTYTVNASCTTIKVDSWLLNLKCPGLRGFSRYIRISPTRNEDVRRHHGYYSLHYLSSSLHLFHPVTMRMLRWMYIYQTLCLAFPFGSCTLVNKSRKFHGQVFARPLKLIILLLGIPCSGHDPHM